MVRRGERAADVREERAVRADEREVGLRVAAVDGEHDPVGHRVTPASGQRLLREEGVEERSRELVLADQRMGEERLARGDRVTGHRGLGREPLVGRDVLHETEELRGERSLGQRHRARRTDPRRELDDVVVLQPFHDAAVADVDDLHVARVGRERRDQRRRRLAVERAAPLLEQRRLLGDLGVAVDLEEPCLDLGHRRRARHAVALLREHGVVGVEVAQVGGRDRAELLEQPQREPGVPRERVSRDARAARGARRARRRGRVAPTSGG